MKDKKCCFECAMCSEYYSSGRDVCDIDNHEIKDPEKEICERFIRADDN